MPASRLIAPSCSTAVQTISQSQRGIFSTVSTEKSPSLCRPTNSHGVWEKASWPYVSLWSSSRVHLRVLTSTMDAWARVHYADERGRAGWGVDVQVPHHFREIRRRLRLCLFVGSGDDCVGCGGGTFPKHGWEGEGWYEVSLSKVPTLCERSDADSDSVSWIGSDASTSDLTRIAIPPNRYLTRR